MSLYSDLEQAIRNTARLALTQYPTTRVMFSHSNTTEPDESYVVINILEMRQIGRHSTTSKLDSSNTLSTQVSYEVMVQFSFLGSLSAEMSHEFTQRLNNNYLVLDSMKKNKVKMMRKSSVRRIPQLRDTEWVDNFNIDVTFSYIGLTQDVIDIIEAVVVEDVRADKTFRVPEGPIPV
jgi:hypothetical protein